MRLACYLTVLGSFCLATSALADSIELINGDVLHGQVLSLDATELKLKSESLGELKLPRAKIAAIQLGDKKPAPAPAVKSDEAPAKPAATAKPAPGTPEDAIRQLQQGGLDSGTMKLIEQALPVFGASPEAKQYFSDRVEGLISGDIDIGAIRKDAQQVVDELEGLKQDLGPQTGPALDPYLGILKRFLRETAPPGTAKPGDKPAPKKPLDDDLRKLEKELKSGST